MNGATQGFGGGVGSAPKSEAVYLPFFAAVRSGWLRSGGGRGVGSRGAHLFRAVVAMVMKPITGCEIG